MDDATTRQPSFHGEGGTLFGILLINLLLSIVTLGIYRFWGRTKVRRYLWSQTEFEGDRFTYHGTGKELLLGYLKVMLVMVPVIATTFALNAVLGERGALLGVLLFYVAIIVLTPVAIVGARRYRLSRTSWRGIRFSFRGRTGAFVGLYVGNAFLRVLTLGLSTPFFETSVRRFMTDNVRFGTLRAGFDGKGGDIYGRWLLSFVLSVLTLGIYGFWWLAWRERYFWSHTTVGEAHFRSTVTGGRLMVLQLTNLLLLLVTLGLGGAWVIVRQLRFTIENLVLEGPLDLAAVKQEAQAASGTGEGLADVLDTGGALDAGL